MQARMPRSLKPWEMPRKLLKMQMATCKCTYRKRIVKFRVVIFNVYLYSDVDKVHDLMDDISEQQQLADEITTAISNPVGFDQDVDEVISYKIFFLFKFSIYN